ncbi:hypothetical protein LDO31_01685 [Luteimonas sp. XNQY3]|nr:hypothetical protein [Luteimonas sp. XNQY3]MCD9004964.1 hypothetical protein [Luteimonas sp. XNQY3]
MQGDSAYASRKALIRAHAPHARDFANRRVRKHGEVDDAERRRNRHKSTIAPGPHVFAVVKRPWGSAKVRCRGLDRHANRSPVPPGLANLYLVHARLAG